MTAPAWLQENRKSEFLQKLYDLLGRDNPAHPHRGTFTGILQEYGLRLARIEQQLYLDPPSK